MLVSLRSPLPGDVPTRFFLGTDDIRRPSHNYNAFAMKYTLSFARHILNQLSLCHSATRTNQDALRPFMEEFILETNNSSKTNHPSKRDISFRIRPDIYPV